MIVIIGGGIFGLSIGWYLAQSGQDVTILEQYHVGQGATWAAAGMLMPWKLSDSFSQPLFDLQRASHQQWPQFARTLYDDTRLDLDYQTTGRLFVALNEQTEKRLQRQFAFHQQLGFEVEWLSGDEARQRESNLGSRVLAAIFTPMAYHVDNRHLIEALKQAFLQAGGCLREHTAVLSIIMEQNQITGVRLMTETLAAKTVIVAAGAWSGRLSGLPATMPRITPRKGQTVILQMSPEEPLLKQPVIGPVYLVPRSDGRLVVGTTVEREAGFDDQPTAGGVFHILRKGQDMVPRLQELPIIEVAAGLRPTAPDRLPVLGLTSSDGLILATGGHSYGILLAPAVAHEISQLILTGQTSPLIEPFTP